MGTQAYWTTNVAPGSAQEQTLAVGAELGECRHLPLAERFSIPYSVLLAVFGIAIGAATTFPRPICMAALSAT